LALELLNDVGPSGLLDIFIMSVLLYGALSWLRASRALRVLQGVLVLGAVYVAARLFQLNLTVAALEALFVVVVVSAIVIFRDEVRLAIERLARFGRGARKAAGSRSFTLSQTLFDLARGKIGALLVIEGRQPLDDLLEGGTELDGLASDPLLKSLFDPSSMGHDGAALVRAGRLVRFACHLPLSTNFDEIGHRGTRHAAALGLAERSDALVIVVSEERGAVSVAHDRHLKTVHDPVELEAEIAAFEQEVRPERLDAKRKPHRLPTALAAIAIAIVLWVGLVYGARTVQRSFTIALTEADLPPGNRLASVSPKEVRVTLTGARAEFFFLDERSIRITLPLRDAPRGRSQVQLDASGVSLIGNVNVKSISPSRVSVLVAP